MTLGLSLKQMRFMGKKQKQNQNHLGYSAITEEIMEDTLKNYYLHDTGEDPQ